MNIKKVFFIATVLLFCVINLFFIIKLSESLTLSDCDNLTYGCYRNDPGILANPYSESDLKAMPGWPSYWYRGQTHAHSNNGHNDGCTSHSYRNQMESKSTVANVYAKMGFDFLLLTDHRARTVINRGTAPDSLDITRYANATGRRFYTPRGEEIGCDNHVTGLNTNSTIGDGSALSSNMNSVCQQSHNGYRAIPFVNHPNHSGKTAGNIINAWYNAGNCIEPDIHIEINTFNDRYIWATVLRDFDYPDVWPISSDDSHITSPNDNGGDRPRDTGTNWIMVKVAGKAPEQVTGIDLTEAIDNGNFYASTGVTLMDYTPQPGTSDPYISIGAYNVFADAMTMSFYTMKHGTQTAPPGRDLSTFAQVSWDAVRKVLNGTLDLRTVTGPVITSNDRVYVKVDHNTNWAITTPRRYIP